MPASTPGPFEDCLRDLGGLFEPYIRAACRCAGQALKWVFVEQKCRLLEHDWAPGGWEGDREADRTTLMLSQGFTQASSVGLLTVPAGERLRAGEDVPSFGERALHQRTSNRYCGAHGGRCRCSGWEGGACKGKGLTGNKRRLEAARSPAAWGVISGLKPERCGQCPQILSLEPLRIESKRMRETAKPSKQAVWVPLGGNLEPALCPPNLPSTWDVRPNVQEMQRPRLWLCRKVSCVTASGSSRPLAEEARRERNL
ncbi:hypothetical protein J1605_011801 [Eschrichtius robustus]|uniref:Uncharacterized protein n=1 Tax=Eschrichtius robustus TaxID=9764 RepID=A0AB34GJL9_ESCRO|nr:hypothetical protein J1605_011801 [Eschrichtius robustus]